jgi:hypothetical protein
MTETKCAHIARAKPLPCTVVLLMRSQPPSRACLDTQTQLCAMCAGHVVHLLIQLEKLAPDPEDA